MEYLRHNQQLFIPAVKFFLQIFQGVDHALDIDIKGLAILSPALPDDLVFI
nr:hypothetical protein Iba_chr15dCG5660 [Ipomoea batatas]